MLRTHKIVIDDKIFIMLRPKSKTFEVYAKTNEDGRLLIKTIKTTISEAVDYALNLIENTK